MFISIVAAILISLLFKPTRRAFWALSGLAVLNSFGVPVGANLLNACLIGFLGIPGIGSVALLNMIY